MAERMTTTMTRGEEAAMEMKLAGARTVVAGLGVTGRAAARFLIGRGARVTASDLRPRAGMEAEVEELERIGVQMETGGHRMETFVGADLVVVSPGVPLSSPPLAAARAAGVAVLGEVELAARFLRGMLVGITGSNGKSTVTALTAHLLTAAGLDAVACGNLGDPLIAQVEEDRPERRYAVELSSFQLEGIERLRPRVAVMTNLTPDHQDRYGSLEEYAAAKVRIFMNQGEGDEMVLNADDPAVATMPVPAGRPRRRTFSVSGPVAEGAYLDGGRLRLSLGGEEHELIDAAAFPLAGRHNLENALAASLAAHLAGAPADRLAKGLRTFRGLRHRMERVAEIDGVTWYDDSKATNVGATRRVVESMDRTVVLILGGKDKGAEFETLRPALAGRVRHLVLMGHARDKIAAALGGLLPTIRVDTMEEAVAAARRVALPGDAVLLAPACASFDAYRSFEERGEHFQAVVRSLTGTGDENG